MHAFKARHLNGAALCDFHRLGVPELALGGIPLGFRTVVEDKPPELSRCVVFLFLIFCTGSPK